MVIAPKMLFEHNNFAGGLNTQYSPFQLEDNESPDCQNVLFDSKGTIKKVRGFSRINVTDIHNLNTNPSIEVDTSGYVAVGGGSTISRDTVEFYDGVASLKCITPNNIANEGWLRDVTAESEAGKQYIISVYLKGSGTVLLRTYDDISGNQESSVITLTSTWTRYSLTLTFGVGSTERWVQVRTDVQQGITFYSDEIMHSLVGDKGIYGLIPYYRYTDATKRLIAMCDTQLWKWTGGASFTSIKTGLTADEMIQGTTFMDLCLIVKESDNPMTYDGTDVLDLGGSPPKGKYITHHVRRIFISGNSSYPNRLYYSDAGDYAIWGVNSYLEIDPIKGDVINGINVVLDSVIMYTDNCIFVLDTQDSSVVTDWIVKRVSTDVGCVAPYTLETVKENTVFWSNLGINTLGGVLAKEAYDFDQIKTGLLSDKITNYIKEFNQANIKKSCSISFDYKLWLSGPYGSDTTNSRIVVYDYINECWSRIKGMNASCFALYKAQDDEDLYFGSPTNGYVYKYGGVDNFDGAAIEFWYETKPFSLENPGQLKRYWNYMVLVGDIGDYNLTVGYSVDFNASFENTNVNLTSGLSLWDQAKWDVDKWDASKDIIIRPVTMKGERGRYIAFRFENLLADQYCEVYALLLKFSVKMFMKEKGE